MLATITYVHKMCLYMNISVLGTTMTSYEKEATTNGSISDVDPNNIHERVKLIVLVPITALIVVCNVVVLLFIACHKQFYRPSYLFVTSLGIADLLVGCVSIATTVKPNDPTLILCLVRMGFVISACVASLYCMMWIAIDRYIAIMSPMKYKEKMTIRKASLAVLSLWTTSFLIGFAPLVGWNSQDYQRYCSFLYIVVPGYTVFLFIAGFVIPMVVIIIVYVKLYRKAQIHIKRIRVVESIVLTHRQNSHTETVSFSNRTWKTVRTLMALIGCFVIAWCPFMVTGLVQIICGDEICHLKDIVGSYLLLLGFSNSFLNPIIYAVSNREFKTVFRSSCNICCRKKIRPGSDKI